MRQILQTPMYRFLIVLTAAAAIGLQGWRTLFNNFAVDIAQMQGHHVGLIQSVREVPGLLALLAVYVLLLLMREQRLAALSILIMGIGVGATGLFPSFAGLTLTTLVMSFGFHYFETANRSLTLQYFDAATAPWVLGRQRSIAAAANIAVGLAIYLSAGHLAYRSQFLAVGLLLAVVGLWAAVQNPAATPPVPQHRRMI